LKGDPRSELSYRAVDNDIHRAAPYVISTNEIDTGKLNPECPEYTTTGC
jgi:hypothetical protein